MWEIGKQEVEKYEDFNSIFKELSGDLGDSEAKTTLVDFLKHNIGFTFEMMCGFRLEPFQELILKALFLRDEGLYIAGRGCSKSTIIGIYSLLYPIFRPGTILCIISANFRSSRRILEASEKIVKRDEAHLLRQCFPNALSRKNDMFRWILPNGSEAIALPLSNGDGLRGTRASTVLVDEGLLITKDIQETIIRPFLTANQTFEEERKIREKEDELIKLGVMTEEERTKVHKNQYYVFSSASYKFQYLYEMYDGLVNKIRKPQKDKKAPKAFVIRMSYKAVPEDSFLDLTQIKAAAANGGEHTEYFKREYLGLFSDASDGYFNVRKMHECTFEVGEDPAAQLYGTKDSKYLLAIDPSYSASNASDFFAMGVYLLVPEERKIVLVHSYGRAGGDVKDHFEYLTYLLTHFNIEFLTIDGSGTEFISGYNESAIAKKNNIKLGIFEDICFDKSESYLENIAAVKKLYNKSSGMIVYPQAFSSHTLRTMNEHLLNQIVAKKIWFASSINANEKAFRRYVGKSGQDLFKMPYTFRDKLGESMTLGEWIDAQDFWIDETKNQTALIEVKSSKLGTLQYDLPSNLTRDDNPNRPRKDHYTCLLMARWVATCYFDMLFTEGGPKRSGTFTPFMVGG